MTHSPENTLRQFRLGEELLTGAAESVICGWKASSEVIGKIRTGVEERWQAAVRQMNAPIDLAEILRSKTLF